MKNKFLFLFLTCLILGGCAVSDHNMYCQSEIDCADGFSCRSKKGGGTECRAKGFSNIQQPSTRQAKTAEPSSPATSSDYNITCRVDSDCAYEFSCRSKTGGGTECRARFSNTQQPPTEQAKAVEQSPQTMPSPIPVQPIEQPIPSKSAIEEAKETCASLGFKSKTEKFGNCVLKLTK